MLERVTNFVKEHPYATATGVFVVGAVVVLSMRGGGGEAQQLSLGGYGYDPQVAAQMAAVQAQADTQQAQATAAVNATQIQAEAQVEAASIMAAVETSRNNAILQNLQTQQAQYQAQVTQNQAAIGQQGIYGTIKMEATHPIEIAGRNLGYTGPFGAGGLNAFLVARMGYDQANQWASQFGITIPRP